MRGHALSIKYSLLLKINNLGSDYSPTNLKRFFFDNNNLELTSVANKLSRLKSILGLTAASFIDKICSQSIN